MSCLALDRPWSRFSPGLAIRRNTIIAAMGHGLVLVASDLKGGSCYAVQWALRHRLPIWCFEAGSDTPPGNRALIRGGQAEPLPIGSRAGRWVDTILPVLHSNSQCEHAATPAVAACAQLDLIP